MAAGIFFFFFFFSWLFFIFFFLCFPEGVKSNGDWNRVVRPVHYTTSSGRDNVDFPIRRLTSQGRPSPGTGNRRLRLFNATNLERTNRVEKKSSQRPCASLPPFHCVPFGFIGGFLLLNRLIVALLWLPGIWVTSSNLPLFPPPSHPIDGRPRRYWTRPKVHVECEKFELN